MLGLAGGNHHVVEVERAAVTWLEGPDPRIDLTGLQPAVLQQAIQGLLDFVFTVERWRLLARQQRRVQGQGDTGLLGKLVEGIFQGGGRQVVAVIADFGQRVRGWQGQCAPGQDSVEHERETVFTVLHGREAPSTNACFSLMSKGARKPVTAEVKIFRQARHAPTAGTRAGFSPAARH
ncbi:hypothetical protein D3C79_763470 [compost metagenome]